MKTYYSSGLSGMEIVEWAIRDGRDVVDNYFPFQPDRKPLVTEL